jgi:hypothetical protein
MLPHQQQHAVSEREEHCRNVDVIATVAKLRAHQEERAFLRVRYDHAYRSSLLRVPHRVYEALSY